MTRPARYLTTLLLALALPIASALAAVPVIWLPPDDAEHTLLLDALKQSGIVQDAASATDTPAAWPEALRIRVGGDGLPRYDVEARSIELPADYLAAAVRAQAEFEVERSDALKRGFDVVEYTLYHLLGHAITGDYDVDNDDIAEAFSTWLMVTSFPNGGEQWLENVHAFGRASQKLDGPLSDYWHRHALFRTREKQLNCLVFGSNIAHFANLYPGLTEAPDAAQGCVEAWQALDAQYRSD
ncbi:MAG: DUF4344 domain-containing metallopeptidase [Pseudomonadota bacterium]